MKKNKVRLVAVSALAITAAQVSPARAQIQLTCSQRLEVGHHHACGNGSLIIHPDGSTTPAGCIVTETPPQAGQCTLWAGTTPLTRNVLVEFPGASIVLNGPGGSAVLNQLRMEPVGGTAPKASFVFTPTEVSNKITLNIGGRLNFSNAQTLGSYTGTVTISAVLQ